jgi:hypothetical protein
MVVSAVANLAVIAEIDRRRRGDGGGSREADDGAVTLRRVAPYTVKKALGAPEKAAVIGRPV